MLLALLAGCSSQAQQNIGMQQLQLLLVQATSLAAMPQKKAQEKAAVFARRAMSGPEMNAMHHGSEKLHGMQATHDLGDALFSLLEAKPGVGDEVWRSRLMFASQAAWLRLTGSMQGDALGRFSYSEGRQLAATQFMVKHLSDAESPYAKAAQAVVEKLNTLAARF